MDHRRDLNDSPAQFSPRNSRPLTAFGRFVRRMGDRNTDLCPPKRGHTWCARWVMLFVAPSEAFEPSSPASGGPFPQAVLRSDGKEAGPPRVAQSPMGHPRGPILFSGPSPRLLSRCRPQAARTSSHACTVTCQDGEHPFLVIEVSHHDAAAACHARRSRRDS